MNHNPQYLITIHDDCYPIQECQSSFVSTINPAAHSQAAMMNYSIPLLRVPNRSRNPLLLFNYMLPCFPYNFDGHEQHRHEDHGRQTKTNLYGRHSTLKPDFPQSPSLRGFVPTGSEISRF